MSLATCGLLFTHTCTVERNTAAGTDSWGNPEPPGWTAHLAGQPCRFWTEAGREAVADTTTIVVVETMRLLLPVGTDVTEQDRVSAVTDAGGVIAAGPVGIRAVLARPDHLELVLVEIS